MGIDRNRKDSHVSIFPLPGLVPLVPLFPPVVVEPLVPSPPPGTSNPLLLPTDVDAVVIGKAVLGLGGDGIEKLELVEEGGA